MSKRRYRLVFRFLSCCLAIRALSGAAQTPSANGQDNLSKAREALQQSRWQDAEQLARSYLAKQPASPDGHYLLAFALFRENKPEASLAEFTHAAQLRKPTALDLRWVALDYVLLKDYPDADRWMTESLKWDPEDGNVWYEMGRIKYEENRFAEAVEDFQKTLAMEPGLVKAEDNLGLSFEGLNQPDKAVEAYRQAISWQSEAPIKSEQPLLNLGILLSDQGQATEAIPLLQQAEALAPGYFKTHATLGKVYLRQNNLAGAQEELEKAVAIDSSSAAIHFQLGQVYRKQGKAELATAEFAKASQIDGSSSSKVH